MQMIGKDFVLMLIDLRMENLRGDLRLGNSNHAVIEGQLASLQDIKNQIDFIVPVSRDAPVFSAPVEMAPLRVLAS